MGRRATTFPLSTDNSVQSLAIPAPIRAAKRGKTSRDRALAEANTTAGEAVSIAAAIELTHAPEAPEVKSSPLTV
jgi:hypothetical protein